jgi:hypothetical protein
MSETTAFTVRASTKGEGAQVRDACLAKGLWSLALGGVDDPTHMVFLH